MTKRLPLGLRAGYTTFHPFCPTTPQSVHDVAPLGIAPRFIRLEALLTVPRARGCQAAADVRYECSGGARNFGKIFLQRTLQYVHDGWQIMCVIWHTHVNEHLIMCVPTIVPQLLAATSCGPADIARCPSHPVLAVRPTLPACRRPAC